MISGYSVSLLTCLVLRKICFLAHEVLLALSDFEFMPFHDHNLCGDIIIYSQIVGNVSLYLYFL